MNKIKNFFINDFRSVKQSLDYLCKRRVPFGIALLYYVLMFIVILPTIPFVKLGVYFWRKRLLRNIER
jgi:hypothetical protein